MVFIIVKWLHVTCCIIICLWAADCVWLWRLSVFQELHSHSPCVVWDLLHHLKKKASFFIFMVTPSPLMGTDLCLDRIIWTNTTFMQILVYRQPKPCSAGITLYAPGWLSLCLDTLSSRMVSVNAGQGEECSYLEQLENSWWPHLEHT